MLAARLGLFGSVFQYPREFHVVEVARLLWDGSFAEHFVDLLVRESVAHGGQQLAEIVFVDFSWDEIGFGQTGWGLRVMLTQV